MELIRIGIQDAKKTLEDAGRSFSRLICKVKRK